MGKPWGWSPQGEPKRLWSAFRSHPAQLEQGACPGKPPLSLHALQSEILRFLWCLGFCFFVFFRRVSESKTFTHSDESCLKSW